MKSDQIPGRHETIRPILLAGSARRRGAGMRPCNSKRPQVTLLQMLQCGFLTKLMSSGAGMPARFGKRGMSAAAPGRTIDIRRRQGRGAAFLRHSRERYKPRYPRAQSPNASQAGCSRATGVPAGTRGFSA